MRALFRFALLLTLIPPVAGCLTSETLVKINADRSGTVEQTILMNVKTFEMLPGMMAGMMGGEAKPSSSSSSAKEPSPADMFDEATLRADAARFGEGVRFVSVEKLIRGDMQGATVVYAFDDINTLSVDQEPPSGGLGPGAPPSGDNPLGFVLSRQPNGRSLLTVRFDEKSSPKATPSSNGPKAAAGDAPPGMEDMITQMFDGFRMAIDVEVNGAIVSSSSPFVTGSRVTVLEMDLGTLLKDKAGMKALERIPPGAAVTEMIPLLKDVAGIKVNESPLTIEFTGR